MPKHHCETLSRVDRDKIYDVIKDFRSYPQFLPWCIGARLREKKMIQDKQAFIADLMIGYKHISETFTTQVVCNKDDYRVNISLVKGPFKYLQGFWKLTPQADGMTHIYFEIDFEFNSFILRNLLSPFFSEAMKKMVSAFEKRLEHLSG